MAARVEEAVALVRSEERDRSAAAVSTAVSSAVSRAESQAAARLRGATEDVRAEALAKAEAETRLLEAEWAARHAAVSTCLTRSISELECRLRAHGESVQRATQLTKARAAQMLAQKDAELLAARRGMAGSGASTPREQVQTATIGVGTSDDESARFLHALAIRRGGLRATPHQNGWPRCAPACRRTLEEQRRAGAARVATRLDAEGNVIRQVLASLFLCFAGPPTHPPIPIRPRTCLVAAAPTATWPPASRAAPLSWRRRSSGRERPFRSSRPRTPRTKSSRVRCAHGSQSARPQLLERGARRVHPTSLRSALGTSGAAGPTLSICAMCCCASFCCRPRREAPLATRLSALPPVIEHGEAGASLQALSSLRSPRRAASRRGKSRRSTRRGRSTRRPLRRWARGSGAARQPPQRRKPTPPTLATAAVCSPRRRPRQRHHRRRGRRRRTERAMRAMRARWASWASCGPRRASSATCCSGRKRRLPVARSSLDRSMSADRGECARR